MRLDDSIQHVQCPPKRYLVLKEVRNVSTYVSWYNSLHMNFFAHVQGSLLINPTLTPMEAEIFPNLKFAVYLTKS